jgi:uncharacterized protein (DUF305 family)
MKNNKTNIVQEEVEYESVSSESNGLQTILTTHDTITDKEYVEHMINHHNSAIDLADLVLSSTNEPRILMLAQNIILNREKEAFLLVNLYNCIKYSWRDMIEKN